jgi:methionyl-tRNA synthetase
MSTFYITTPIYYANSLPHLGHLHTTLVADCVARYYRQRGYNTFFLTGTDEHGINVQRAAASAGRSPKEHVDYIVDNLKKMFSRFGLDSEHGGYDIFMRTTDDFHYRGVAAFWQRVAKSKTPKGRSTIYKGFYEGWFCAPCAAFKTEDEYEKSEGSNPRCPVHELELDRVAEESYFFRLSDYGEALLDLYEKRPELVRPDSRRNEVISFVRGGLQDLSISRPRSSVEWGIPVPDEPSHTVYVWFDALTNYLTAIGFGNEERERVAGFEKYWPAVHLVGKDILRFHAVYWPAFLMAADLEQPVAIVAHGLWLDQHGRKMSKTLGNVIQLEDLLSNFPSDVVRYYCMREMPLGQDGRFGYEPLIDRANSDLASGLGNLASRTLTMVRNYFDGQIPSVSEQSRLSQQSEDVRLAFEKVSIDFKREFENYSFNRALEAVWGGIARIDKFISDAQPWNLAKQRDVAEQDLALVIRTATECLRFFSVLLAPVMPLSCNSIWTQLGESGEAAKTDPATVKWDLASSGKRIGEIKAIFPRLDKEKILKQVQKEAVTPAAAEKESRPEPSAEKSELINIDDFAKVELRVGQVLTAERVPKADKLLKLSVDIGEEAPRQILAGIAQYYEPEKLIGRKIVIVANLQPRKLRGLESHGMVLAASLGEEGRPVLATFTEDVPNGARLK